MWNSSIGIKVIVAVTGCLLLLFVLGHLIGNLQIFLGQDALNIYGEKLRAIPPILCAVRIGLLAVFLVHVVFTIRLALLNRQARPVAYAKKTAIKATLSSRTMVVTGLMTLAFVLYHLMHFTFRVTNPAYQTLVDAHGRFDVYSMVILGFQNVFISVAYIVAMFLLGYHLNHGIASLFQTIGWNTPRTQHIYERLAFILAAFIVIGNIAIPISILIGWVTLPGGGM
jgi:succinate dehydrogenase / fumarate reductase, cytochrome b subunit